MGPTSSAAAAPAIPLVVRRPSIRISSAPPCCLWARRAHTLGGELLAWAPEPGPPSLPRTPALPLSGSPDALPATGPQGRWRAEPSAARSLESRTPADALPPPEYAGRPVCAVVRLRLLLPPPLLAAPSLALLRSLRALLRIELLLRARRLRLRGPAPRPAPGAAPAPPPAAGLRPAARAHAAGQPALTHSPRRGQAVSWMTRGPARCPAGP
jgi:hypothetical protein